MHPRRSSNGFARERAKPRAGSQVRRNVWSHAWSPVRSRSRRNASSPAVPRSLFAFALALIGASGLALAQVDPNEAHPAWPARFVTDDGAIALYLDPSGPSPQSLLLIHGLPVPLELRIAGSRVEGLLGPDVRLLGALDDSELVITLTADAASDDSMPTQLRLHRTRTGGLAAGAGPLLRLLSATPDLPDVRLVPSGIGFADLQAALVSEAGAADAVGAQALQERFLALAPEERSARLARLLRIRSGPPELVQYAGDMIDRMPHVLGLSWFDIEGALIFGEPPAVGTLLATRPEAGLRPEVLEERGYVRDASGAAAPGVAEAAMAEAEETAPPATALWSVGEDGAVDFARRDTADPFAGMLGFASRIVELPGTLANARFTALARAMAASAGGALPSLGDAADFRAVAGALDAAGERLVQAHFLSPAVVGVVAPDPLAVLSEHADVDSAGQEDQAAAPPPAAGTGEHRDALPPYLLAAFADLDDGTDAVALIALVYADPASAGAAAHALAARLDDDPATVAAVGDRAEPVGPSVHAGSDGLFVAVAGVRYPRANGAADASADSSSAPAGTMEAATPRAPDAKPAAAPIAAGAPYAAWLNAYWQRELTLLELGP